MKQMIASRSMVMVHGLMVAGPCLELELTRSWARELALPGGAFGSRNQMQYMFSPVGWPFPQLKRLKREFIL